MPRIVMDLDAQEFQEAVSRLEGSLANAEGLLLRMAFAVLRAVDKQFPTQGRHFGMGWKALEPATVRKRRKGGVGARILMDTGRLRQSMGLGRSAGQVGVPQNADVFHLAPTELQVGSNLEYAAIHQFGGRVEQGARTQHLRFARLRGGRFSFVSSDGRRKGRRASIVAEARVAVRRRTIVIYARPYLPRDASQVPELGAAVSSYINKLLEG